MEPVIDLSKEYGLVLEGGGAKGAYQIGAWKALREAGVKIKGVAGTSVGALNGALICMDDIERAERLWRDISYSKVMDVDDDHMAKLFSKTKMTSEFLKETLRDTFRILGEGGTDITPLRQLIEENVNEDLIRQSPVEFYSCTFSVTDRKELNVDMKAVPEGEIKNMLLASSYLPVFKNTKLNGKTYMDGGLTNVLPMNSLLDRGYENLILIRIFGAGHEKKVAIPDEATILEIAPRVSLGSLLQFDGAKSRRNMKIGYYDALRTIYGLDGKIYYIEQKPEECYYLRQFMAIRPEVLEWLLSAYKLEQETSLAMRRYLEEILPLIAAELKLGKNWNYKSLYLAMLEATAKWYKVAKYQVYTVKELLEITRSRGTRRELTEEMPAFMRIILDLY
ncbi:MAG: patatin-like phospholipase family protein [Lachnospiraceae bacterium]|jgi:NTE family protein|nr:patatin-like phospholipase family protein [Lachnospiraceae bacterium]